MRILLGIIAWNGKVIQKTPAQLMEDIYGGDFEWIAYVMSHETRRYEDIALAAHHLKALIVEWEFKGDEEFGPIHVTSSGNGLSRNKLDEQEFQPIKSFASTHRSYLSALKQHLEDRVTSLPGQTV
jgi:hypothetical protein